MDSKSHPLLAPIMDLVFTLVLRYVFNIFLVLFLMGSDMLIVVLAVRSNMLSPRWIFRRLDPFLYGLLGQLNLLIYLFDLLLLLSLGTCAQWLSLLYFGESPLFYILLFVIKELFMLHYLIWSTKCTEWILVSTTTT